MLGQEAHKKISLSDKLTRYEKNLLKRLSLLTLKNLFNKSTDNCVSDDVITENLQHPRGVFVTLYSKNHELRGCMGRVVSDKPLYKAICEVTRLAALHDSRFNPVTIEEIPDLGISISVLNEPKLVDSYKKIRLGIDGIILKYKNRSALFLPHVATEQGWNLATTLEELSRKAGLMAHDWKSKEAKFEVFQSIDI
ncbi:AmmeMemoRadiSam system protein A [Candidatus Dependentiae bacterium]|nr:AmmeMemoRadiSam system protein A [Candidatus Dependentiae bacterium]